MRNVEIRAVLNGWVCQVGCQTVVFTDRGSLLSWLDRYMVEPAETEKAFIERAVNAKITMPTIASTQPHNLTMTEVYRDGCSLSSIHPGPNAQGPR